MSTNSNIEWTGNTWNPFHARRKDNGKVGWHCEKPSTGCKHCYAEKMNLMYNKERNAGRGTGLPFTPQSRKLLDLYLDEKVLQQPLHWRKPKKIFPCSMTDLFAEFYSKEDIFRVLDVMRAAKWHTFQPLTKRAERMCNIVSEWVKLHGLTNHPDHIKHIWFGVTVEDNNSLSRIPWLLQTPAAVRWISAEPLLEEIDIEKYIWPGCHDDVSLLNWLVIGGESGPGARPFNIAWARKLIEQGKTAGVPVFMKQAGADPYKNDESMGNMTPPFKHHIKLTDKKGGNPLEWPEDIRVREYPQ